MRLLELWDKEEFITYPEELPKEGTITTDQEWHAKFLRNGELVMVFFINVAWDDKLPFALAWNMDTWEYIDDGSDII